MIGSGTFLTLLLIPKHKQLRTRYVGAESKTDYSYFTMRLYSFVAYVSVIPEIKSHMHLTRILRFIKYSSKSSSGKMM